MPILSSIGRRHWKVRLLLSAIYLVLIAGALSMVYPFLLMMAGSSKSAVDVAENRLVPRFLVDDLALYRKYTESLFNEQLSLMQAVYDNEAASFGTLAEPASVPVGLLDAWADFLRAADLPASTYSIGFLRAASTRGVQPLNLRRWKDELFARSGGRIDELNRELGTAFINWNMVDIRPEDFHIRRSNPRQGALYDAFRDFKARQPLADRFYFSVEGFYRNGFLKNRYARNLAAYNARHGTSYTSWDQVRLDEQYPVRSAPHRPGARRLGNLRARHCQPAVAQGGRIRAGPVPRFPARQVPATWPGWDTPMVRPCGLVRGRVAGDGPVRGAGCVGLGIVCAGLA
jgi:hypothetical protein